MIWVTAVFMMSIMLSSCGTLGAESGTKSISGTAAVASGTAVADQDWKSAYESYMDNIYKTSKHQDRLFYFIKNIDQTDVPELFLIDFSKEFDDNMKIYVYRNDGVQEIGSRLLTGTTHLLYSENPSCPGVFTFDVGGGLERYGYMTIQEGEFSEMNLWNEDFSGISKDLGKDRERIEVISSDKLLISESKKAYENNQDIRHLKLRPDNVIQESTVYDGTDGGEGKK